MMTAGKATNRNAITWVPDYRMPPRHHYPAALDDCLAVYRRALGERPPTKVIISGTSAGGNLAAALVLRARDEGLSMPAALVLLTPQLDLTAFSQVEPDNRLVARTLETRWEAKLVALAEAEAALATARGVKPAVPDHDAFQELAADLPRLWDAPTTSHRDRKRLLRTLIADVTLLLEQDSDAVRIGVRWHTGASDELVVERRGPGRTPPQALAIVHEYGATHSNAQISKNAQRCWPAHRQEPALHPTARRCGARHLPDLHAPHRGRAGRGDERQQAAHLLGIPADATHPAAPGPKSPPTPAPAAGASPGDAQTQEIYRQKVANSVRLKPTPAVAGVRWRLGEPQPVISGSCLPR